MDLSSTLQRVNAALPSGCGRSCCVETASGASGAAVTPGSNVSTHNSHGGAGSIRRPTTGRCARRVTTVNTALRMAQERRTASR